MIIIIRYQIKNVFCLYIIETLIQDSQLEDKCKKEKLNDG